MHWVFHEDKLAKVLKQYCARRFQTADPKAMERLMMDFLTSQEVQENKMVFGVEDNAAD